jgi:hypothetical protein
MIHRTQKLSRDQSQSLRVSGHRSMDRAKMLLQVVCATRCQFLTEELVEEVVIEVAIEAVAEEEVHAEAVEVAVAKHQKKNTQSEVEKVIF